MLKKLVVGAVGLALCSVALASEWNLQPAASKLAADIHWLHEAVMLLVLVLFVGVFGFMFWSCYAHRKSVGHKAAQFHENTTVEILWTVIPSIILVIIAIPVTKAVIAQKDTSNPEITVKVTGMQWKWAYDYVKGEGEVADEFFRRGVRDYIGTAWEVNDEGAVTFASELYARLLGSAEATAVSIGEALLHARQAVAQHEDLYGALWAAYQHYGDPQSVLVRPPPAASDGAKPSRKTSRSLRAGKRGAKA